MIQLIGYALVGGFVFIVASPIILFFLAFLENVFHSTPSAEPVRAVVHTPVQPVFAEPVPVQVEKPKKRKPKTPIHTVSPEPAVNGSIKEFTLPDGSKIAIDCEKVEMEEKKVF